FSELDVLTENHQVFLKDHLQGTLTPVFNNTEYAFSSSVNSNDEDRFELVFSNQSVTGTSTLISGGSVLVFPNPSTKGNALTIAITGMESNVALVSITDALGRNVISRNSALLSGGTTTIQIQENLPAGVYMVRTTCGQTTSTQKLVIK
ncbi:MAG TPA: T9SS type A sorting domain-containing protein, partial [Catalimonadaceae bacterium]|nr:T9SS type A sorting domain-containing protein [Catalimonadaceae bacterium]